MRTRNGLAIIFNSNIFFQKQAFGIMVYMLPFFQVSMC